MRRVHRLLSASSRTALILYATWIVTCLVVPTFLLGQTELPNGFYRYPTIGGGIIVFASEGDLWKVPVEGGTAVRLTAHEGEERFPHISPDGHWIAFTAQYEGNDDVYVMPIAGGEPMRLTWHPVSDQAIGWSGDGKLLFRSKRDTPHGDFRIYKVDPKGGIPDLIPLEPCAWLSFEPQGNRLAMQKMGLEFHNWKRYKGGEAEKIYVGTLVPLAFEEVTHYDGKSAFPMWADNGRIFFITDRWGRPNLASMNPDGGDVKRITAFTDYDVRWPSMGDGKIVYQHKMDIWSYDLIRGQNEQVPIMLPSDRLQVRERFVDPLPTLQFFDLANQGERIVLETRGDLFITRTKKKGLIRRITESSLSRTKFPAFSPDGQWIAAWSEVDGEEQLFLHSADNSAPSRQVGRVAPGWNMPPVWSPDGKRLAWGDQKYRLFMTDVGSGVHTLVDSGEFEIKSYEWSPDSRYVAYDLPIPNQFSQVRIWDSITKMVLKASDPMFNSFSPSWDPSGKYLYYLSARAINPYLDQFEARFIVNNATLPVVLALQADSLLPFAPRSDLDLKSLGIKTAEQNKDVKAKEAKGNEKGEQKEKKIEPIRIDAAGLMNRIVQVPVPPGNYSGLSAIPGKLIFLSTENIGMMPPESGADEPKGGILHSFDMEKEKLCTLTPGVLGYDVSLDKKVLVYRTKEGFVRIDANAETIPKAEELTEATINLSGWSVRIAPRDEWKQILHEAWRLQRDFFYDPDMHGVDWLGVWRQYGSLLDRVASRDDVADLIGEMFGELNVGHAYHGGGDLRRGQLIGTGLLAADLVQDSNSGFWEIK